MLPICVVRWVSHKTTASLISLHFQTTDGGPLETLTPATNSHEVLKDKYSLYSPAVWQEDSWFHSDRTCSQLLVNHGVKPLYFLDTFQNWFEIVGNGRIRPCCNFRASNKKITLLFTIYSQVISRRWISKEKGIFTKFLTFNSKTDTLTDNCLHLFSLHLSFHFQVKDVWIALWKSILIWRDTSLQT